MMSDVTDPQKLTREQLFQALSDLGVRLPVKKAKKQVLVDLYVKHLTRGNLQENESATTDPESFQLSSGDEELEESHLLPDSDSEVQFKTQGVKVHASNPRRPNSIMPRSKRRDPPAEVKEMSDSELAKALRIHGVDVGPILVTTRRVYERKLTEIIQSGNGGGDEEFSASEEEYMDEEAYTDEEDMVVDNEPEVVPPAPRGYEPTTIRQRPQIREDFESSERSSYSTYSSSSAHRGGDTATRSTDAPTLKSDKPPKKGFSWLTKLIIFLVLALLVYLVVTNIETIRPKPAALTGDANV